MDRGIAMKLEIQTVKNGYIMKDVESGDTFVYQENSDLGETGSEVRCFVDLLQDLDELIGPSTSRYSKERIFVRVEPGDKYDVSK